MTSSVNDLRVLVDNLDEYIHIPGGIDRLKKMILHLAVSGQLVPQNPSEGTGEQLYQQIQAEKQKLIAEGKIKKQKPMPKISDDEVPFEIPETWDWVRLGSIYRFINGDRGKNYPSKDKLQATGEIPFFSAVNLSNKKISSEKLLFLTTEQFEALGSGKVRLNDLVICIRGSLGKFAISNYDTGAIASSLVILRNNTDHLAITEFRANYLETPLFYTEIKRYDNGTAQPNLSASDLMKFILPLPPLAEQKRIVAKVDSLFALIDQLAAEYTAEQAERGKLVASSLARLARGDSTAEQNLALTHLGEIIRTKADAKVLRQTILHLAVSGQLAPQDPTEGTGEQLYQQIQAEKAELIKQGKIKKQKSLPEITEDEIPFEIPESWKWARTVDVGYSLGQKRPNRDFYYVDVASIDNSRQYLKELSLIESKKAPSRARKIVSPRTVIYSTVRPYLLNTTIINSEYDKELIASTAFAVLHPFTGTDSQWILTCLVSSYFTEYTNEKSVGAAYPAINDSQFSRAPIPLPPLAEQKRIVAKTTQLLDLVAELEGHLD